MVHWQFSFGLSTNHLGRLVPFTTTQPLVGVVPLAGPQVGSRVQVPVGASPVFSVARKKIGALNL